MKNEVVSIVIERPVEEVYAFMSDPRNRLRYDPGLLEVRQTPAGPLEIGTRIVEVRPFMGKKAEMVTEVFELEANRVISYRTLAGDPTGAFGSYRFALAPEGTRLTLDFTVAPKGLVKLAVPLTTRRLRRDIEWVYSEPVECRPFGFPLSTTNRRKRSHLVDHESPLAHGNPKGLNPF